MKQTVIFILFIFLTSTVVGQSKYPTQDSLHIFWQPNLSITHKDYQGQPTSKIKEIMEKYQFSAAASVGIWSILDIPKKKKDRYKKLEKVYFAPAFDKMESFTESKDSLQIEMQNLFFDICEVWARWARKELKTLQDTTNATGTLTIFYMQVKQDMNNHRVTMFQAYFKDVFIDKKEGLFMQWRQDINKMLRETEMWATTPEECYRLMTKKPIEEDYIEAPYVVEISNGNK